MNPLSIVENEFDTCLRCGECLKNCPVLHYPEEKAIAEITKLRNWDDSEVLEKCISCYSCNAFCPNGNHPYELILSHRYKKYLQTRKIPGRTKGALPLNKRNFLYFAKKKMSEYELSLLKKWEKNSHSDLSGYDEVILAGCNFRIYPYILDSPIFGETPVIGADDLCCGEVYFRMGLFNIVEKIVPHIEKRYKQMRIKKLIVPCMAGFNMLKNVLPEEFGAKFDFEVEYGGEWILKKLERGEIEVKRKLNRTISIQESCHAKVLGEKYIEIPRKIIEKIGGKIREIPHWGKNAICCGAADGIRNYNPIDILRGAFRELSEAKSVKTEIFSPYCATCLLILSTGKLFYPASFQIEHLYELVHYAAGYNPKPSPLKRAFQVIEGLVPSAIPEIALFTKFNPEKDLKNLSD